MKGSGSNGAAIGITIALSSIAILMTILIVKRSPITALIILTAVIIMGAVSLLPAINPYSFASKVGAAFAIIIIGLGLSVYITLVPQSGLGFDQPQQTGILAGIIIILTISLGLITLTKRSSSSKMPIFKI